MILVWLKKPKVILRCVKRKNKKKDDPHETVKGELFLNGKGMTQILNDDFSVLNII